MASTSRIEIKKCAFENNFKFIKSLLKNEATKISIVIKSNAYGHGTRTVVPAMEDVGVNHFSVYSSPEARVALEAKKKNTTLMIMGFIYPNDFDWIIENEVEFFVSNPYTLNRTIEHAKKLKKKAIIHLDVETGMNRTGFTYKNFKKSFKTLKANAKHLHIKGICTHFAGAESIANHLRVKKQFSVFKRRLKMLHDAGIDVEQRHVGSSAATISYPETQLDMVRTGILAYGYWPTKETFINYIHHKKDRTDPLRRAMTWKSQVISIKYVPESEFIGYGLSFQAQHDMKVMIVPVGYANGYSRSLSNNGKVIVNEQISQVIGSVNMNMIICDITNILDVEVGDEVVLIGTQGENEISFASFAEMNQALNYEILARLPENIERKII